MSKKIKIEKKKSRNKLKKTKILEKTNSRKLRGRGFPMPTKSLQKTIKKPSAALGNFEKSLWNHFKKSETFTNQFGLKNQYRRWV